MRPLRLVVLGTLAANPFAGMAWMHMQIASGLARLGHEVWYLECSSSWPYDPIRKTPVNDDRYAVPYLERVVSTFGLGDRWAYRRSYADGKWVGQSSSTAEQVMLSADAVFNVSAATNLAEEGLETRGLLVYYGTDPGWDEIWHARGDETVRRFVAAHDVVVTYGECIGTVDSRLPPLPGLKAHTRQPILLDLWETGDPPDAPFTTVANWRQSGRDVEFEGELYTWSKHHEFLKFMRAPALAGEVVELATSPDQIDRSTREMLSAGGWQIADAHRISTEPEPYRRYIQRSKGEFTVAKDQNVRLRSGWFSERSACYLAAGRPVITQDTGFGRALPTGKGLLAFETVDEAVAALEEVVGDFEAHSKAARQIAEEYFRAETVLEQLLSDIGLT